MKDFPFNAQKQSSESGEGISRRKFIGTAAAGGAALAAGSLGSLFSSTAAAAKHHRGSVARLSGEILEKSIPQLEALLLSGQLTSRQLVQFYIQRIAELNPILHAVIELNPQAVGIAAQLDNELRAGIVRGPLHGIPILVKDNIATDDNMETTAGSLALVNSKVPGVGSIRLRRRPPVVFDQVCLFRVTRTQARMRWTSAGVCFQHCHGSAVQEDQQRRPKA